MVLRKFSAGRPTEQRIALSSKRKDDAFLLSASVPGLDRGEIAELYFEFDDTGGLVTRVPAEAPAIVFPLKHSVRQIRPLAVEGPFILDAKSANSGLWLASRGGGVANGARQLGLRQGLPSAIARFVLPDDIGGRVFIGTNLGIGILEPGLHAVSRFAGGSKDVYAEVRTAPAALSMLDGTLLFQVQRNPTGESRQPAELYEVSVGKLAVFHPPAPFLGFSSIQFDSFAGCWLMAGFASGLQSEFRLGILRRCEKSDEKIFLPAPGNRRDQINPDHIIAIAVSPRDAGCVIALEYHAASSPRRRRFGLFAVNASSGEIVPFQPQLESLGVEITSLATDWRNDRLLIGTFGQGIFQVSGDQLTRLPCSGALCDITALDVSQDSEVILVGTRAGAYESRAGKDFTPLLPQKDSAPEDMKAEDIDPQTGKVLLSSNLHGIAELQRSATGVWSCTRRLRSGAELPAGVLGDVRYGGGSCIFGTVYSEGLFRLCPSDSHATSIAEGLTGDYMRLMVRRSGEVWVSETPIPFGGRAGGPEILRIQNGSVSGRVPLPGKEAATIGRWVEVPERQSVFAATRAGILEIQMDGSIVRLSINSAAAIVREPHSGTIAAVGTAIERWDGQRFSPVISLLEHPRSNRGAFNAGSPIDVAIDSTGLWYILYSAGRLAVLDGEGRFVTMLDGEDGVPFSATRILTHPQSGDLLIGSSEGVAVLTNAGTVPR
jgi:hypothetical protein